MNGPEKNINIRPITCCCCGGGDGGGIDISLRPRKLINQHDYFERKCGEALHHRKITMSNGKISLKM